MPEMHFHIRWPDGRAERCYSPSLVVQDYLVPGESYALADFLARSRTALTIASDRVAARYGRPCALAHAQLARIEAGGSHFAAADGAAVAVEGFDL